MRPLRVVGGLLLAAAAAAVTVGAIGRIRFWPTRGR